MLYFFWQLKDFFLQVLPLWSFRLDSVFLGVKLLRTTFAWLFSILELSSGGAEDCSLPSTRTPYISLLILLNLGKLNWRTGDMLSSKSLLLHEDIYHLQYNHQDPSFRMISSIIRGACHKQESFIDPFKKAICAANDYHTSPKYQTCARYHADS